MSSRPPDKVRIRSATRSADIPGPGSRFGHEVTMRQRRLCAIASEGTASAPAVPKAAALTRRRRVIVRMFGSFVLSMIGSPPLMKMMHWSVAGPDLQAVGRLDRGGDVAFGGAHGLGQR